MLIEVDKYEVSEECAEINDFRANYRWSAFCRMFNVTLGLHWFHFTLLCVLIWKVVPPRQPIRNKCKPISVLSPVPSWASNLVQIKSLNSDDIFVIDLLPCWCAMVTMRLLVWLQSRCALAVTECVVFIKSYQISVPLLQTHDQNKV